MTKYIWSWKQLIETYSPETMAHLESIKGEEISRKAFGIAHKRFCHSKNPKRCTQRLFRILKHSGFIIKSF